MFAALGQETRLSAFLSLQRAGHVGMASGDIAKELGVPHNTLSAHLAILVNAGLATSERRSRSIIYRAAPGASSSLMDVLLPQSPNS
ncbi:ArsR/SmtB family transcription factor [Sphingomonas floccifaciens]|uniref:ArsR/SmtB family transcription factor n=1 Tax=Sphingomonas floccifaciens TaxID=1844115 RepID=A0ABW4NFG4_9SPHN